MLNEYKIKDGQNYFDVLASIGVPIEKAMSLIKSNGIANINVDFLPNETISYLPEPADNVIRKRQTTAENDTIVDGVYDGQSIYDLALMTTGRIEDVYKMIRENNFGNINYTPKTGDTVTFQRSEISNVTFYNDVIKNRTVFNTGTEASGILLQENEYYILVESGGLLLY